MAPPWPERPARAQPTGLALAAEGVASVEAPATLRLAAACRARAAPGRGSAALDWRARALLRGAIAQADAWGRPRAGRWREPGLQLAVVLLGPPAHITPAAVARLVGADLAGATAVGLALGLAACHPGDGPPLRWAVLALACRLPADDARGARRPAP